VALVCLLVWRLGALANRRLLKDNPA